MVDAAAPKAESVTKNDEAMDTDVKIEGNEDEPKRISPKDVLIEAAGSLKASLEELATSTDSQVQANVGELSVCITKVKDKNMQRTFQILSAQQKIILDSVQKQSSSLSSFADLITVKLTGPKSKYSDAVFINPRGSDEILSPSFKFDLVVGSMHFWCSLQAYCYLCALVNKDQSYAARALATSRVGFTLSQIPRVVKETEDWLAIRDDVWFGLLKAKAEQCEGFKDAIMNLNVENEVLYQSVDKYWGTGSTRRYIERQGKFEGANQYGKLLLSFREKLVAADGEPGKVENAVELANYCCPEIEVDIGSTPFVIIGDEQIKHFTGTGSTRVLWQKGLTFWTVSATSQKNTEEDKSAEPSETEASSGEATVKAVCEREMSNESGSIKRIILVVGGHDLAEREAKAVVTDFEKLCKWLTDKYSQAEVFVVATPPRLDAKKDKVEVHNENLRRITRQVAGMFFIDLASVFKMTEAALTKQYLDKDKVSLRLRGMSRLLEAILGELPYLRLNIPIEVEGDSMGEVPRGPGGGGMRGRGGSFRGRGRGRGSSRGGARRFADRGTESKSTDRAPKRRFEGGRSPRRGAGRARSPPSKVRRSTNDRSFRSPREDYRPRARYNDSISGSPQAVAYGYQLAMQQQSRNSASIPTYGQPMMGAGGSALNYGSSGGSGAGGSWNRMGASDSFSRASSYLGAMGSSMYGGRRY